MGTTPYTPYRITQSDDGLSVRCEFTAHYITDEQAQRIRSHIDELQAENDRLREEYEHMLHWYDAELRACVVDNDELRKAIRDVLSNADDTVWVGDCETLVDRLDDLGIEVE